MQTRVPAIYQIAVDIWNDFDGTIDWAGIPLQAARYGVEDLGDLIECLVAIRKHKKQTG